MDGILLTLADMRTNLARLTAETIRQQYSGVLKIHKTHIPVAVKAAETSATGQSIFACPGYPAKSETLWRKERPRSDEPFAACGESDKRSAPRRGSKVAQAYADFTKEVLADGAKAKSKPAVR
ncbi:MAG: hypothetical protein LBK41_01325 [Clostridiales bacterium]|nr:hypothetical protein [Clostridiales bacterium]